MRLLITCALLIVSGVSIAIPNPEAMEASLRARADTVVRFEVISIRYAQKGEMLYTFARARILEAARGDIETDDISEISYAENHRAVQRWWEDQEREGIVGSVPPEVVPRLRKGQVATGWFKLMPDGELIPAAGSYSFETETLPELVEFGPEDEIVLKQDQYALVIGREMELWINRFELVDTCPENASCIHQGDYVPVISLICDGVYQEIFLRGGSPRFIDGTEMGIELLADNGRQITLRLVKP